MALNALRRHVIECSDERLGHAYRFGDLARDAKIREFGVAAAAQTDVGWFDITMHKLLRVQRIQPPQQLSRDHANGGHRELAQSQNVIERPSIEVLHCDVDRTIAEKGTDKFGHILALYL